MNTYEYQRSRSLFDLCPRSLRFILSNIFCCKAARRVKAILIEELLILWVVRLKICPNSPGHLTKMTAMPIYGKNPLKIFFSETRRLMTFKLGIQHQGLRPYKVSSNDNPGLTLNFFTARSTLLPGAFVWKNALGFIGELTVDKTLLCYAKLLTWQLLASEFFHCCYDQSMAGRHFAWQLCQLSTLI